MTGTQSMKCPFFLSRSNTLKTTRKITTRFCREHAKANGQVCVWERKDKSQSTQHSKPIYQNCLTFEGNSAPTSARYFFVFMQNSHTPPQGNGNKNTKKNWKRSVEIYISKNALEKVDTSVAYIGTLAFYQRVLLNY